jgi:phytanoyl-CoA hydroxylase
VVYVPSVSISTDPVERYWDEGFVVLPGLIDRRALARWEDRFVDLALGRVAAPETLVIMRDIMVVKGIVEPETPLHGVNKLLSFEEDPVLFEYCEQPELLAAVRSLIGAELRTISTNVFNKPPGVDGRHPFHQDLRYFALRPADKIVATWTAMSPMTRRNGCLAVIPGSHRGGPRSHGEPDWEHVNSGFFAAEDPDLEARVHLEMQPGDTLLFHPLLLHGSGRNRSPNFRRAISAHYASAECERPEGPRRRQPVMRRIADP